VIIITISLLIYCRFDIHMMCLVSLLPTAAFLQSREISVSQKYRLGFPISLCYYTFRPLVQVWNLLAYYVIALRLQSTILHKIRATLGCLEHKVMRPTVPIAIYVTTHFCLGRFRGPFFRNFPRNIWTWGCEEIQAKILKDGLNTVENDFNNSLKWLIPL